MKCLKCNHDIDDNMLVCPNCKKVLKLVCPKCNTINKTNTCKKCGFAIISKCHQCGKINQTINGTCSKCGFNTYTSVAINSSNIDEFACITIEFTNLKDIKKALGSTKLIEKFKTNLDQLILKHTSYLGLKREIIEDVYVIRFNKDSSFSESAQNAMKTAIEIQNAITELNFKLKKVAEATLQCNIAILKRDIYSLPEQYKSGFDIKMIYQNKDQLKLLNNLQIITDQYIYDKLCETYDLRSLTAMFIKNEMMTFFELNLRKYIKIPKPKEEEEVKVPDKLNIFDDDITEEIEQDELYDVNAITFNELKCSFTQTKSINIIDDVLGKFRQDPKKIISIKSEIELLPNTGEILEALENSNLFKNVFRVTCHNEMKCKPYGFFYELISSIYNFSQCTKNIYLNHFDMFNQIDPSGFVKDLINLHEREFPHPEDVRYSLFDIFFNIARAMKGSLLYIENFDKIDDTSYEVLQLFFEEFEESGISYLLTGKKDFSLHKNSHFLLANPNYIEITIKPTTFKQIIEKDVRKYSEILDSYYMQNLAKNTKGSILYLNNAIDYLLEKDFLELEKGKLSVTDFENILIPTSLNELIAKRLQHLAKKDINSSLLLSMLLFIGPMVDIETIKLLQIPDTAKAIQTLTDKKYIYIYGANVYIQNYNLIKEVFIGTTPIDVKQVLAEAILSKAYSSMAKHPVEAVLYNILEKEKQEFIVWEYLSRLSASLGDFSAYLNCSVKFLKLLDNNISETSQKTIEEYKMEVYENISNLLYQYKPNEIHNIAQIILSNLEQSTEDKKVINLCNKMLQGCLIGGNYSHALELTHKILSRFPNSSLNPQDSNFNIAYFLVSLIKVEVLFSIGNLKDCIESADELLNIINQENFLALKPEHLSEKQFEEVVLDAMSFAAISRIILLRDDLIEFIQKIQNNLGRVPDVYELYLMLNETIRGTKVDLPANLLLTDDKFYKITINILKAFNNDVENYKKFAGDIYQAKIQAKMNRMSHLELICDLLIGHSYFKLKEYKKASSIYNSVLENSSKNGLKTVTYLAWYFISLLKFEQKDVETAYGIANNAIIQLEKDPNSSDFLFYLFRVLLFKIFLLQNNEEAAELCINNAKFIQEKYGLNFDVIGQKGEPESSQEDNIGELS